MIGLITEEGNPGSFCAIAFLFGGQIACMLPMPGVTISDFEPVWILDWRSPTPPPQENYDSAIERMLRDRGWSTSQIDDIRLPQGRGADETDLW
jgi:hypothetical protein